jgi:hypothetical protein
MLTLDHGRDDLLGRLDAVDKCLGAGLLDRRKTADQRGAQDVDYLPIAVVRLGQSAPHGLCGARLASQHR